MLPVSGSGKLFAPSFCIDRPLLPTGAAAGSAGRRADGQKDSRKLDVDTNPSVEVRWGLRDITSEPVAADSPSALRHRAGPAVRSAQHLNPSRRDLRTHAAQAAAEFSGRVRSRPMGQGASPYCIRTDQTTKNRDRHRINSLRVSDHKAFSL